MDGDGNDEVISVARESGFAFGLVGVVRVFLSSTLTADPPGGTVNPLPDAVADYLLFHPGGCSFAVADAGDIDLDGRGDLLLGCGSSDVGAYAYVMLGADLMALPSGSTVDLSTDASRTLLAEGVVASVALAGDVDGDGIDELLVGAPWDAEDAGTTYVVSSAVVAAGSPDMPLELAEVAIPLVSAVTEQYSGFDVSSAGDVNADGLADVLIGAPGAFDGPTGAGAAYIWLGDLTRGQLRASRFRAASQDWSSPASPAGAVTCRDLYVVAADAGGDAVATFNCGAEGPNVGHYSFISDAWWGSENLGLTPQALSVSPLGEAAAAAPGAANIFR